MSTEVATIGVPPLRAANSLDIMLDEGLFNRAERAATKLAKADGFVPRHLLGKTEACFAVVMQATDWRLSPLAVARCTYQTPSGQVGYEGKLIHAVIEASGSLVGGVSYEHFGDWTKVQGKFEIRKSDSGSKPYAHRTWTEKDTPGLGVIVRAKLKGELEAREFRFELAQAFPLNSTLWATDPKTQICYTACRRFSSLTVPHLVMGVRFDREDDFEPEHIGPDRAKDITPADERRKAMEEVEAIELVDQHGSVDILQPIEVDAWIKARVAECLSEEELAELAANNPEHVKVGLAASAELEARKAKAKPNGNGKKPPAIVHSSDGSVAADCPSYSMAIAYIEEQLEAEQLDLINGTLELLSWLADHAPPELRQRAEALRERVAEPSMV